MTEAKNERDGQQATKTGHQQMNDRIRTPRQKQGLQMISEGSGRTKVVAAEHASSDDNTNGGTQ